MQTKYYFKITLDIIMSFLDLNLVIYGGALNAELVQFTCVWRVVLNEIVLICIVNGGYPFSFGMLYVN